MARERGETKGEVEKISGAGDENNRMELGPSHEVGSGQKHWRPLITALYGTPHETD